MPAYDQKDIEAKRRVKTAEKPAAATPSASRSGGYRVAASDAIAGDEVGNPDAQASEDWTQLSGGWGSGTSAAAAAALQAEMEAAAAFAAAANKVVPLHRRIMADGRVMESDGQESGRFLSPEPPRRSCAVAELESRKQEQLARQHAKEQEKLRLAREQQKRMQESKPTTLVPLLNTTLHREGSVLVHNTLKRNYDDEMDRVKENISGHRERLKEASDFWREKNDELAAQRRKGPSVDKDAKMKKARQEMADKDAKKQKYEKMRNERINKMKQFEQLKVAEIKKPQQMQALEGSEKVRKLEGWESHTLALHRASHKAKVESAKANAKKEMAEMRKLAMKERVPRPEFHLMDVIRQTKNRMKKYRAYRAAAYGAERAVALADVPRRSRVALAIAKASARALLKGADPGTSPPGWPTVSNDETGAREPAPDAPVLCAIGRHEAQGPKETMDDRHVVKLNPKREPGCALAAIFDGHVGPGAAHYAAKHIVGALTKNEAGGAPRWRDGRTGDALRLGIAALDEQYLEKANAADPHVNDGTCAVVAVVRGAKLTVANVGDSRAVLGRWRHKRLVERRSDHDEWVTVPTPLSRDHSPWVKAERERIEKEGGSVGRTADEFEKTIKPEGFDPEKEIARRKLVRARRKALRDPKEQKQFRVFPGGLGVSRALGDLDVSPSLFARPRVRSRFLFVLGDARCSQIKLYNPRLVPSKADIVVHELGCFDRFLVLSCHGLFDVLSNTEVVEAVADSLARAERDPALELIGLARERGATTNLTAVVMVFGPPGTEVETDTRASRGSLESGPSRDSEPGGTMRGSLDDIISGGRRARGSCDSADEHQTPRGDDDGEAHAPPAQQGHSIRTFKGAHANASDVEPQAAASIEDPGGGAAIASPSPGRFEC